MPVSSTSTTQGRADRPAHAPSGLRPEIQALRALAALLVVLYHLWPGRLPGGFMGVDVFFVISGFLITSHLAKEATTTGTVRLGRFWARRARRLLPAAYLVLATSAVAVFVWVPQINWVLNFREILASALYFQNWRLAFDAVDYLAAENSPSVAQHYWTLSVEEQFYVAWPLLMLAAITIATRLKAQRLAVMTAVVGVATVGSFAYSWWLTFNNASYAYFSTFTRAWEFGAGALLALLTLRAAGARRRGPALHPVVASLLSWAGLGVLAYCGLRLTGSTPFPGTAALLPVLGAVAVISAGMPDSRLSPSRLLALRPVQWTGDVSYPLYLWHWPPIILLPVILEHPLGFAPRVGILVATFVAAGLTKRFVEDPIRFGRRFGIQRSTVTFAATATAAVAMAVTCLGGVHSANAAADRAEQLSRTIAADAPRCFGAASMVAGKPCSNPELDGLLVPDTTAVRRDAANYKGCSSSDKVAVDCAFGDATDTSLPRVVVIGDSHARAILAPFVTMAREHKIYLRAQVKGGCAWSRNPHPGNDRAINEDCYRWRTSLASWLDQNADQIDVIVTTALAHPQQVGTDTERAKGFADAWTTMTSRGIPVVAIKDNPYHRDDTNDCLALQTTITSASCALPRDQAFPNFDPLTPATKLVPGSHLLDFTSFYCTDTSCPSVIGGVNVYRDRTHVSKTYLTTMGPYIYDRLVKDDLLVRRTG